MPIAMLTISDWDSAHERDKMIESPTWSEIESAIRALNNENLNDLYLYPEKNNTETYLCIGGGSGRYVLTGSIKNQSFPTLIDPDRSSMSSTQLVVGGQLGDYPSNWVMDLCTTLQTAKAFYDGSGFKCGVKWQTA
ncbi:hypothetical protein U737_15530 [Methylomonas sp. LW13]|nr:hypothetical protein U737_15530 [Methylomonas sp. LW13]